MSLARFMYGRYGSDNLSRVLLVTYIVLAVAHFITALFTDSVWVYLAFTAVMWAIVIITLLRMLSRNIYARQRENAAYLRIKAGIANRFKAISGNLREKDKKYVICPSCKAVIRFPRKKGVHNANCPKCRQSMKIKI